MLLKRSSPALAAAVLLSLSHLGLAAVGPKPLVDFSAPGSESRLVPTSAQVTVTRSTTGAGVDVAINPGPEGYPGIDITPTEGHTWDLSGNGHVEAKVTNTSSKDLGIALRVDNDYSGDAGEPFNSEMLYLKPGESGVVKVIFGASYHKPGYKLKPAAVVRVKLFVAKDDAPRSFRIESLEAAGSPNEAWPVDPESIRTKPTDDVIVGSGVTLDQAKQLAPAGVDCKVDNGTLKIAIPANGQGQNVVVKPAGGRWDLSDDTEIHVSLRNDGSAPVTPKVKLVSNGGESDEIAASDPIAPGAKAEIVVPFMRKAPWTDTQPNPTSRFTSNDTAGIVVAVDGAPQARSLVVESIKAVLPEVQLPDWLGKRPPVDGQWTQTFDEEFNEKSLDESKWDAKSPNYWDPRSHFSKDNILLGDGTCTLRFEKKTGHQNDDPNDKQTDYATGFLHTYGKWVQRYGYFEARLKIPAQPGLWPAFWMMPDRGAAAGEQWVRASTENGGMEFDIMEHLSRWGPHRYDIAQHWDGYAEKHKSTGTDGIYAQPDKDGYITTGLLWTPGSAIYYCNGKEVARIENPRISNVQSYLILEFVSGGWDNNDLVDEKLPADFKVDYVRAWQRADLASPVDGPQGTK